MGEGGKSQPNRGAPLCRPSETRVAKPELKVTRGGDTSHRSISDDPLVKRSQWRLKKPARHMRPRPRTRDARDDFPKTGVVGIAGTSNCVFGDECVRREERCGGRTREVIRTNRRLTAGNRHCDDQRTGEVADVHVAPFNSNDNELPRRCDCLSTQGVDICSDGRSSATVEQWCVLAERAETGIAPRSPDALAGNEARVMTLSIFGLAQKYPSGTALAQGSISALPRMERRVLCV